MPTSDAPDPETRAPAGIEKRGDWQPERQRDVGFSIHLRIALFKIKCLWPRRQCNLYSAETSHPGLLRSLALLGTWG